MGCYKTSLLKLFWSAQECGRKNTECTGKSPDPLYLRAGDAIHLKGSGTETGGGGGGGGAF